MRTTPGSPMLLTFAAAARELGVSVSTVQRLVRRGALATVPLDTGQGAVPPRRIRRSDLAAYVAGLAPAGPDIAELAAAAPPLTPGQRAALAALLGADAAPGDTGHDAAGRAAS